MGNPIKDTMQRFGIKQILHYLEGNPEENIPKLMDLFDKFTPANWYRLNCPILCGQYKKDPW